MRLIINILYGIFFLSPNKQVSFEGQLESFITHRYQIREVSLALTEGTPEMKMFPYGPYFRICISFACLFKEYLYMFCIHLVPKSRGPYIRCIRSHGP